MLHDEDVQAEGDAVTAKHSILVMIARYQGPHNGGGVGVTSQVLEYETRDDAEIAMVQLAIRTKADYQPGTGRFAVEAVRLYD